MRVLRVTDPRTSGDDVTRVQRVLSGQNVFRTNFGIQTVTGTYGIGSGAATREAHFHAGFRIRNCTTAYGPALDDVLNGNVKLTPIMRVRRWRRRAHTWLNRVRPKRPPKPQPGADGRARFLAELRWGILYRAGIGYSEDWATRNQGRRRWQSHVLPLSVDCSMSIDAAAMRAGLPDPAGQGYSDSGTTYTGTVKEHCEPIPMSEARPGDLCVFGPGTGVHMVAMIEAGSDPLTFSHGQASGPLPYRFSVERYAHGFAPFQWYRLPGAS